MTTSTSSLPAAPKAPSTLTTDQRIAKIAEAVLYALAPWRTSVHRLSAVRLQSRIELVLADSGVLVTAEAFAGALQQLKKAGFLDEHGSQYQLTPAGLVATREEGDELTGCTVKVNKKQSILGPAKFPGRIGTALFQNSCGRTTGGLWYVLLKPTPRATERIETFWTRDLELLIDG